MAAAAVPWIIKGGVALGSHFLGKKMTSSAMKRSPEEQQALAGAHSALQGGDQQANQLSEFGMPVLRQASDYYSTLLKGNRAQQGLATAAPKASITDLFRGAQADLNSSNMRGGERDLAGAHLRRDRTNQLSQLTAGVQPMAADALMRIGGGSTAGALYGKAASAQAYTNLLSQGADNRANARQEGRDFSKDMGSVLADMFGMGKGDKGVKTIPSVPIGTGMGRGPVALPPSSI